ITFTSDSRTTATPRRGLTCWTVRQLLRRETPTRRAQRRPTQLRYSRSKTGISRYATANRSRERSRRRAAGTGRSLLSALRRFLPARPDRLRSEERRVGKECRYRWSLDDSKKKKVIV